jgi:hypothetical protein
MNQAINARRLRMSFVAFGASLVALIVVYVPNTLTKALNERRETPRLAVDSLVKALRIHHRQTGRFPSDFRELEARVWKHKNAPDFGADGRGLSIANYYYIYYQVDIHTSTIWIIPIGQRRDEGATHFLLLKPDNLRRWKGAPLSLDEAKNLPPVPQYRQMSLLGMTEQRPIELSKRGL